MVGTRIGKYLTDNGIKQSFVAQKVGLTASQMSDICSKDRSVDSEVYYRICKVLNVPLERFLEEEEG